MTSQPDSLRVDVDSAAFLRLIDADGSTITCLQGCLWITRDGCAADIQLDAGQGWRVAGPGPVIVCGFGPSVAQVRQPASHSRHTAPRWLGLLLAHRSRHALAA